MYITLFICLLIHTHTHTLTHTHSHTHTHSLTHTLTLTHTHTHSVLFIADWSYVFPRIATAKMDGSGFKLVITTGLRWPNGVAVDPVNIRIYWIDAYYDRLESATYNGGDRRVLINKDLVGDFHPYGIVYFRGFIFWSNIFNATMHQARVRNNELVNQIIIHDRVHDPAQFQIISDANPRPGGMYVVLSLNWC